MFSLRLMARTSVRTLPLTSVVGERVSISFEDGTKISMRADDYRGPEALQFSLDKDCTWVV